MNQYGDSSEPMICSGLARDLYLGWIYFGNQIKSNEIYLYKITSLSEPLCYKPICLTSFLKSTVITKARSRLHDYSLTCAQRELLLLLQFLQLGFSCFQLLLYQGHIQLKIKLVLKHMCSARRMVSGLYSATSSRTRVNLSA